MARTVEEIRDQIIEEKELRPALDGLTSDSKVAVWRLWAYVTALVIHTHEVLWDIFKADIDVIIAAAAVGNPAWYKREVLKYQHGESLIEVDLVYQYAAVNESAMIVEACSIVESSNGTIFIKAVKSDGNGGFLKLSNEERDGLTSYVNKIKFAGAKTAVFTNDADSLEINYDLYYDPIVPLSILIPAIEEAVAAHLADLQFDGVLNVNKFTDVLQSVEGVSDPVFTYGASTVSGGSEAIEFDVEHQPGAGFFELSDTITNLFNFIPKL